MAKLNLFALLGLVCISTLTAHFIPNTTTPTTTPLPETVVTEEGTAQPIAERFIPGVSLKPGICCLTAPFNETYYEPIVRTEMRPVTKTQQYLYWDWCPAYPRRQWCKEYRTQTYTDYELVRKEVQRLVTKETTCRSSDLICCDGKVLEYGQCLTEETAAGLVDLNNQLNELLGPLQA